MAWCMRISHVCIVENLEHNFDQNEVLDVRPSLWHGALQKRSVTPEATVAASGERCSSGVDPVPQMLIDSKFRPRAAG